MEIAKVHTIPWNFCRRPWEDGFESCDTTHDSTMTEKPVLVFDELLGMPNALLHVVLGLKHGRSSKGASPGPVKSHVLTVRTDHREPTSI